MVDSMHKISQRKIENNRRGLINCVHERQRNKAKSIVPPSSMFSQILFVMYNLISPKWPEHIS